MTRYHRGLKPYEALVKTVCCVDDYNRISDNEWEGCLGVACVIAVIEGVEPTVSALTDHLKIPYYDNYDLKKVYNRLRINGVFSLKYKLKEDSSLQNNGKKVEITIKDGKKMVIATATDVERNAWCTIAGLASGLTGIQ